MSPNNIFPPFSMEPEPKQAPRQENSCVSECCETVATQYADISIPVEIRPTAVIGEIETQCCGDPVICCKETSSGKSAEITITQKINIKIPIEYCTEACIGDTSVSCSCCEE